MSVDRLRDFKSLRLSVSPSLLLLSSVILLLALLPRLGAIDRYITPDELHWVDRSIKFSTAIAHGQWRDTIQSGHPGVTTMWLGSLGINLQHALDPALPDPAQAPTFAAQNPNASRQLAQYLSAARLPVILVSALNIMLLFLLLSRKLKRWIAFLAAGLVALDPFAVGLGGILHVDSLLATFSLISLAALWIALDQAKPTKWLILSGLLAGLTALTKSPAIVLGPIALIAIGLNDFRRQPIGHMLRSMVIWGLSATAIFFALYPAMWVAPFAALGRMAGTAERFSEQAHAVNYFFGSHDRDPGALFYPAVIAYRSTPILWAGLVTTLGLILRARSDDEKRLRAASLLYGLFAILFVGLITVGAKKLDRYVFPALLALDIVGAMGLAFAIEKLAAIRQRVPALVLAASISLCLLITAAQFTSVWPLTLWAYNPILGGYDGASRALPVGGGESAEIGAALSASPYASKRIAISDIVGAAPFFAGDLVPNDETGYTRADYILLTAPDFQLTPESSQAWSDSITPVLTVTVQNRAFAWLYPNRWLADDRQRLLKDRGPGDALITDYAADLPTQAGDPMIVLPGDTDEASAIDLLTRVAASHTRVFFIHYSASPRRTTTVILRLLDTPRGKALDAASP